MTIAVRRAFRLLVQTAALTIDLVLGIAAPAVGAEAQALANDQHDSSMPGSGIFGVRLSLLAPCVNLASRCKSPTLACTAPLAARQAHLSWLVISTRLRT